MSKIQDSNGVDNPGFRSEPGDVIIPLEKATERLTYSWENLNIFASVTQGCGRKKTVTEKHILKDVTGICRPGELLAIMGASGAGKTTLLNALTFRSDAALKIKGSLYVNGRKVTPTLLTSRSAYVQQDDLFIGTMTVKEQLVFQANLRMDKDIPTHRRMERVEEVMKELSLVKCAGTLIGIPGRIKGISGGEMKRLAFACEMLTNPPLMFCDEPTTGLDSFMARNIVLAMRNMAQHGKTIISTIHQPSSEVFEQFDRVLLMAEGRVAFLGSTEGALDFFKGLGHHCPENFNPADFFISTLAIQPGEEEACREFVGGVCDTFSASSTGQGVRGAAMVNARGSEANAVGGAEYVEISMSPYKASWGEQCKAVLKRSVMENIREPMVLRVKLFQTLLISLLVGLIYLDQGNDYIGVSNINGAIFLLLTQMSFSNTFGVVNAFCAELPVFLREHFNGIYRVDVYYLSKNVAELPFGIVLPLIFTSIMYFMVGMNPLVGRFFATVGILILVANAAVSFGYMISCLSKDVNVALALSAPLLIPLMLFGGFFLNSQSVPWYFIWIKYLSWFNYGNEALIINQWAGIQNITCPDDVPMCSTTGDEVITTMGYNEANLGYDIGILLVLIVGYRFIGFLLLVAKTSRKDVKNVE